MHLEINGPMQAGDPRVFEIGPFENAVQTQTDSLLLGGPDASLFCSPGRLGAVGKASWNSSAFKLKTWVCDHIALVKDMMYEFSFTVTNPAVEQPSPAISILTLDGAESVLLKRFVMQKPSDFYSEVRFDPSPSHACHV